MDNCTLTARRLRQCREESGETLEEIGQLMGVNRSTVLRWERGNTEKINLPTLHSLARHFRVSVPWLAGLSDDPGEGLSDSLRPDVVPVPVMGSVRAGCGGLVTEELSGSEPVDAATINPNHEYFWLRVTGDSMTPLINDRDLVLVRRQEQVDSGRLAVVTVDNEEGLVKRVIHGEGWLELHSVNPYYPPRRFEEAETARVTVLGLVAESKRKYL